MLVWRRGGLAGVGFVGVTLRLAVRAEGGGRVADLVLEGAGARRTASARVGFGLSDRDREDVRWYLEDYLQYPVDPAPDIAREVEARLAALGEDLFRQVFQASPGTMRVWDAVWSVPAFLDTRFRLPID